MGCQTRPICNFGPAFFQFTPFWDIVYEIAYCSVPIFRVLGFMFGFSFFLYGIHRLLYRNVKWYRHWHLYIEAERRHMDRQAGLELAENAERQRIEREKRKQREEEARQIAKEKEEIRRKEIDEIFQELLEKEPLETKTE